jgi:alcohol dehydrogenase class IV
MVNAFEFATAGRVVFGEGKVKELPAAAKQFGKRAIVVCGGDTSRIESLLNLLRTAEISVTIFNVRGEPEISSVVDGAKFSREEKCEVIIAIGGGSVIDAAKAIAALATNTENVFHYLEVIGEARPLTMTPLPVIAAPTTAGTGAEVTRNAVLASRERRVKVSLRHPGMLPRVAIVDPELTHSLSPALTASTGMDALTQLIEPFVSARANALTDALCREAIPRVARALPRAFENGRDAEARRDMALGSLFGGFALANAGLGAVHGFASPIGGMFPAPHGAVCASLLVDVMEMNRVVATEMNNRETLARLDEAGRLLTGRTVARAADGERFVRELCEAFRVPKLRDFGIQQKDFPSIAEGAARSSSMKGNPVALSRERLLEILQRAW